MGNQTSTSPNQSILALESLLRPNKHFSNQSIRNLSEQKLLQLMQDLKIDTNLPAPKLNILPTQYSLNSMNFSDDFSFEKISHRLTSRTNLNYPHIFNIKNFKIEEHKNLCSLARKIYVSHDGYQFTLKDLINQKLSKKESFSEEDILCLMSKITEAVVWMHDNEFKNIPLDSESIFFIESQIDHQTSSESKFSNYTCKIIDQDLVQTNSYKNFLQSLTEVEHQPESQKRNPVLEIYLSPELLEQAKNGNFYCSNLNLKSDIFTLGMMMMELCCQEEMYFCYSMDTLAFDYESLIHRIAKISYSNELKLLLAQMLEYDENNRIGFVSLKEKLSKLIIKPFEETRKLKRRSSSTMLRELLSCSRASASVQSKEPTTQKHGFSRITSLSQSHIKIEQNTKNEETLSKPKQNQQSLRKSNSLVNLKCKTNSFLTSKKTALTRVNSSSKIQTDVRKVNNASHEETKVDYKNILKRRMKTESQVMNCPQGQKSDQSLNQSVFKTEICGTKQPDNQLEQNQNYLTQMQIETHESLKQENILNENYIRFKNTEQNSDYLPSQTAILKSKEPSKLSYVQKKVIHLDKINFSTSQVLPNPKSLERQRNIPNVKTQLDKTKENQDSSSTCKTLTKQSLSSGKIAKKEVNLSVQKAFNLKPKETQTQSIPASNKNWIMGKLKSKKVETSISNLILVKKDKSSSKKKEQSVTKQKSITLINPLTQEFKETFETERTDPSYVQNSVEKNSQIEPASQIKRYKKFTQTKNPQQQNEWNKNDTIIKRLDLTEEKEKSLQKFDQKSSSISGHIKDQMELINKVIEQCELSSSRWQEESKQFDLRGYETERSSEGDKLIPLSHLPIHQINKREEPKVSKTVIGDGQFKKKSKVIDIDLGKFSYETKIGNQEISKKISASKDEKKLSSKLQKLKQLTIFTEQSNIEENFAKNLQNTENKENNMMSSNLQLSNKTMKEIKKPSQPEISYQNHEMNLYNPIPRVEQVNIVKITPSLITPNNLNDLNKFYGKGETLQSIEQSFGSTLHKKDFSTLSKPFQEIQLNYNDTTPLINSPNFPKDFNQTKECQAQKFVGETYQKEPSNAASKNSGQNTSIKKDNYLYSINAEELTFRLKPKTAETSHIDRNKKAQVSKYQKVNYFEKQDGSFVMREENPIKKIQSSSIIGQDKSGLEHRNTVEELFKESSKYDHYGMGSKDELKESFYEGNEENSQKMNSSCDSINLSEIEYQGQQSLSFIYPEVAPSNQRGRKYKHVSILESGDQSLDHSKKVNLNLKMLKQITEKDESQIQSTNRNSEYDTYRGYLSSNKVTNTIQLGDNFLYEGQLNSDGQFQGNGMISRKNPKTGQNDLIYTGSFVNGLYHGFGTLYEIQNQEDKRLKLPNTGKRMSFGEQRLQKKSKLKMDKYFSMSQRPIKYEGQFVNGSQSGFGTFTYENGDRYSGCIRQGVIEGYGTYNFCETGESISGIWKNNSYSEA